MGTDAANTLPPELLVVAVVRRVLLPSTAVTYARAISDRLNRVVALAALVPHAAPDQRASAAHEALSAIPNIPYGAMRAKVLAKLASFLPESTIPEALSIARSMTSGHDRAIALTALVPFLATDAVPQVIQEAFTIASSPRSGAASVLIGLIPHLGAPLLLETITIIRGDAFRYEHAKIMAALWPHLAQADRLNLLPEALAYARGVQSPYHHAVALTSIAPFLSAPLLQEALGDARSNVHVGDRFEALIGLTPHLPVEQRSTVLEETLITTRDMVDEVNRAGALLRLVPLLPSNRQREAILAALTAAQRIGEDELLDQMHRSELLGKLASHLPIDERSPVLDLALATARRIEYPTWRICAFADIFPHLSVAEQAVVEEEALATIQDIDDEEDRSGVLTEIAASLPTTLVRDVLSACYGFPVGDAEFDHGGHSRRQPD